MIRQNIQSINIQQKKYHKIMWFVLKLILLISLMFLFSLILINKFMFEKQPTMFQLFAFQAMFNVFILDVLLSIKYNENENN